MRHQDQLPAQRQGCRQAETSRHAMVQGFLGREFKVEEAEAGGRKGAKAGRGPDGAKPFQPVVAGLRNFAAAVILAAGIDRESAAEVENLQMRADAEPAFAKADGVAPSHRDKGQGPHDAAVAAFKSWAARPRPRPMSRPIPWAARACAACVRARTARRPQRQQISTEWLSTASALQALARRHYLSQILDLSGGQHQLGDA